MQHTYKSTFRFTTLTAIGKDDLRKAKHIISHIIQNPEAAQFRQPVNWEALKLFDYPTLIPNPMDLGTVLSRINEQQYQNVEEFLDDTQLIWDNCKTYNLKGSWIYQLADKLEKNCKKMLKNYFPTIPLHTIKKDMPPPLQASLPQKSSQELSHNEPKVSQEAPKMSKSKKSQKQQRADRNQKLYYQDEQEVTLAQKMKLADKFKILSPSQNQTIVEYIKSICPNAFKQQDQKIQILVDNMDVVTFKQLIEKVQEVQFSGSSGSKKIKLD